MSTIRNNLDQAKSEYFSARYPGDLASELLAMRLAEQTGPGARQASAPASERWGGGSGARGRMSWGGRLWIGGSIGSAVAAGFVAAVMLRPAGLASEAYPGTGAAVRAESNPGIVFIPRSSDLRLGGAPVNSAMPVVSGFELVRPGTVENVSKSNADREVFRSMTRSMTLQPNTLPENYTKP